MTALKRKVRRVAAGRFAEYVVTLHPRRKDGGPLEEPSIELRMAGHRRSWSIELGRLYVVLVDREVAARKRVRRGTKL